MSLDWAFVGFVALASVVLGLFLLELTATRWFRRWFCKPDQYTD